MLERFPSVSRCWRMGESGGRFGAVTWSASGCLPVGSLSVGEPHRRLDLL